MTTSIRTIARKADTSVTTVSRVLNNNGYVSADVRERVLAAVKELNYTPNRGARMLRGEPSRTIGLLMPSIDVHFFGILAQSIEQALFEKGYQTLICSTSEDEAHEARYLSMMMAQQVDGLIVASARGSLQPFQPLVAAGIPILAVDRDLPGLNATLVSAEHEKGGRMMAEHILSLGHKRIAAVAAPGHSEPVQLRLKGIAERLAEDGIQLVAREIGSEHSFTATHAQASRVISAHPDVTALICTSDIAAIGAIHALLDKGLSVPGDCSVIGFDDLPEAGYVVPRLTTIAQPIREMGLTAVSRLLAEIDGKDEGADRKAGLLPVKLVLRQSTGPARG